MLKMKCCITTEGRETLSRTQTFLLPSNNQPITESWAEMKVKERSGGDASVIQTNTVYYIKCSVYRWNPSKKQNLHKSQQGGGWTITTLYLAKSLNHHSITLKVRFIQKHGTLSITSCWTTSVFPFLSGLHVLKVQRLSLHKTVLNIVKWTA